MIANFTVLQHLAAQLGLRLEPTEQALLTTTAQLSGLVDGTYVELHQWQADFLHVYLRAYLAPPADLGLALAPSTLGAKIGALLGRHDTQVGDAAFDDAFVLHAQETARAQALFTPALRETLLAWHKAKVDFVVTDESVYVALPMVALWGTGAFTSREVIPAEQLLDNLRAAIGLAHAFDAAIRTLPPAEALAGHVAAFRAYAEANHLAFSPSPLEVHGHLGNAQLFAHPKVLAEGVVVALELRFDAPLPATLHVRPRRLLDVFSRLKVRGAPTPTGDEAFDDAFHAELADGSAAKQWLTEPVRSALVALQTDVGEVELNARGLRVTTRALPPAEAFAGIFDRLCQVERELRVAIQAAGPYR